MGRLIFVMFVSLMTSQLAQASITAAQRRAIIESVEAGQYEILKSYEIDHSSGREPALDWHDVVAALDAGGYGVLNNLVLKKSASAAASKN